MHVFFLLKFLSSNAHASHSNGAYYLVDVLQFMLRIARCSQNRCTVFLFRCTHDFFIFMLRAQQQKLNTHSLSLTGRPKPPQRSKKQKKITNRKIDAQTSMLCLALYVLQFEQGLNIDRLGNILKLTPEEKPSECLRESERPHILREMDGWKAFAFFVTCSTLLTQRFNHLGRRRRWRRGLQNALLMPIWTIWLMKISNFWRFFAKFTWIRRHFGIFHSGDQDPSRRQALIFEKLISKVALWRVPNNMWPDIPYCCVEQLIFFACTAFATWRKYSNFSASYRQFEWQ